MSGMITTLLMVGLMVGGAYVLISPERRCEFLGLCGQEAAAVVAETPATETAVVAETPDTTGDSKGCCECKMQGSTVKCLRNNTGSWFNPPPGTGGSNDQDVQLSLDECNKGCGDPTGTGLADPSKPATKQTKVATGSAGNPGSTTKGVQNKNNSVTGSGQKINPPAKTSTGAANPYKSYVNANPKGYKPGGGTYYANAFLASNDDRYIYYPNDVQSYYTGPEYLEYRVTRPVRTRKRPPHYVRGNILYTYVIT